MPCEARRKALLCEALAGCQGRQPWGFGEAKSPWQDASEHERPKERIKARVEALLRQALAEPQKRPLQRSRLALHPLLLKPTF